MEKILLASLVSLLLVSCVFGQSTTISGQVTDSGGQTWNNGTVVATFVPNPQKPNPLTYSWTGGAFGIAQQTVTGVLGNGGAYSISVPSNTAISPVNTQWTITVTSQTSPPFSSSQTLVITGGSQTINFTPPAITLSCGPGAVAYADSEVQCQVGGSYYNIVLTSNRTCTTSSGTVCSVWSAGGGGITSVTTNPSGACTVGQANIVTTSGALYTCGPNGVWVLQGNPIFNAGFQGFSPQDFGGFGNGREAYDAVLTSGSAIVTSATAGFCNGTTVACIGLEGNGQAKVTDVGRQFEALCAGTSVGNLTVASVQSATQITLSSTQAVCNGSPLQIFIGTDDTAALQAWITAGMAVHTIHNFYLPKGTYYTSKPLVFNAPAASECSAHVNPLQPITCGITLLGAGATVSLIHPATQPNFNWTLNSASVEGIVHINGFSFGNIQDFAVEGDQVTQASGLSTTAAGFYLTANSHLYVNSIWVNRIVTSGATQKYGLANTGCFECSFYNSAIEGNGLDGNAIITMAEKELWDTIFFESGSATQSNVVLGSGAGGAKQDRFHNIHFQSAGAANVGQVFFAPGFQIARGHSVVFDAIRLDGGSTTDVGFWVGNCTPVSGLGTIVITGGSNLINVQNSATARTMRVDAGVTCGISVSDSTLDAGGSTGVAVLNNSTTNPIYLSNVNLTGVLSGTGAGVVFGLQQTATGWGGLGGIAGTYFLSNQGTALVTGNIALSGNFGTGAAVSAPHGFNQSFDFTITNGSAAVGANPTVTVTLPNALPAATTSCSLVQTGGTNAVLLFDQTTLSATAPIFTLQGTPTVNLTFHVHGSCGP